MNTTRIKHNTKTAFGVGVNCLSGTIPNEICQANYLEGFSIDGASTAENCKIQIVDFSSLGLNAFVTRRAIRGTVPECLFNLPKIKALSLSGNELIGTLPDVNFINSSSLVNVSLSYNRLTGTISSSWLGKNWKLLDLSYRSNKIHGTLPDNSDIRLSQDQTSILFLEENRLSGNIPSISNSFSKGNLRLLNPFKLGKLKKINPGIVPVS